jgi:dipeptidyl aminopeptidase/acylaminoacyl peptidase
MAVRNVLRVIVPAIIATIAGAQNTSRISKPIEFWNPDWSPDGRSVVFESTLSGKYSIYVINGDGTGLRRLTADTSNNEQPRWSPDGKRIVFSSDRGGTGLDIHVMNADGSNLVRLTTMPGKGGWYQSSFSPDGQWIAFQGRPDNREVRDRVYVVRSDGSALRLLSDSTAYGAEGPRWSADGKAVEFRRVPYPVRLWDEMGPPQMKAAREGETRIAVPIAGGVARPAPLAEKAALPAPLPSGARRSSTGRTFVYEKAVDGWNGLYTYDVVAKKEALLIGGPGAGPLGYLRTATLSRWNDTIDTFESPRSGGVIARGNGAYVIRELKQVAGARWELSDAWYDSTGKETARQSMRTAPRSLVTELEFTRATTDSASMTYTRDRSTGWVVPGGAGAQLFDGPSTGERYAGALSLAALAMTKPANGAQVISIGGALYGGNPLTTRVDTIRVVRRDTLMQGGRAIPLVVVARGSSEFWLDESSGAEVLSRGNAGPQRYWWHIRRGVSPPRSP